MEKIKTAFERNAKALALEPSLGRATSASLFSSAPAIKEP
jgi:hypothetical protein